MTGSTGSTGSKIEWNADDADHYDTRGFKGEWGWGCDRERVKGCNIVWGWAFVVYTD